MVAATQDRPVKVSGGKLRFHSPITHRVTWKRWDEMEKEEKDYVRAEYPAFALEYEGGIPAESRWGNAIAHYVARRELAIQQMREAREDFMRDRFREEAGQFDLAVENLREAEATPQPKTDVWFCVYPGQLTTRIPPAIKGEAPDDWIIRSNNHIFASQSTVHIAWVRRIIRLGDPGGNTIEEQPHGMYPLLDRATNDLIGFGPWEMYSRGVERKVFAE